MTDQRPDPNAILALTAVDEDEDEVGAIYVTLDDAPAPAGALVARDLRGPRELHWRAARARYDAAVRRRDAIPWGAPERRQAEADARRAGRLLEAETGLSVAWFDFAKDA